MDLKSFDLAWVLATHDQPDIGELMEQNVKLLLIDSDCEQTIEKCWIEKSGL